MIICTVLYCDDTRWQEGVCDRIWVLDVSHPRVRCWCHTLWDTHHPPGLMSQWLMNEMHPFMWTTWSVYEPSQLSSSVHSFFICVQLCVCVCVTERLQLDFYCIFSHTNRQKGNFEILEEVHEDKIAKKMNCDFNKELMIFNKTLKQLCITHSLKNAFEDKCFRAFQPIFFWLAPNLYVPDEVTKSQK